MYDFLSIVMNAFGIIGLIISVISIFLIGSQVITATVISYTLLIIFLVLLSTQIIVQKKAQLSQILKSSVSVFMIILFLVSSLYLTITYQDRIIKNNVYSGYRLINTMSTLLLIIEIFIFYGAMQTNEFKTNHLIPNMYSICLILLSLINILSIACLGIMLKYFYTDG
jgi:hypothetical protein